jgi:hypothetical protein
MKKFLTYIFILFISVIVVTPFKVQAQVAYCTGNSTTEGNPLCYNSDGTLKSNGSCPDGYVPLADASQGCRDPNTPDTTISPAEAAKTPEQPSCFTWTNGLNPNECINGMFETIAVFVLRIMSFLLYLAGVFLNKVLEFTVVNFKQNISGLQGINLAWKAIKDLMNIAFIFILIYESIKVILSRGNAEGVRKFVVGIVMAAILINFSLFFTKVLIDASNIVTIGFYNIILGPNAAAQTGGLGGGVGLSNPIMARLGLGGIYNSEVPQLFAGGKGFGGIGVMALGGSLLILVSAFVFFAVSILFIVRYIVLIFLLLLSPIAYMGLALDFMEDYSKQWWDSLRGQLIFAPVFMIMIWAILTIMSEPGFITGNIQNIYKGGADGYNAMGLLLNFTVIIGLIIGALVISKSTATRGSKFIGQLTGRASALAGGALFGGGVARNTLGRFGNQIANSEKLKETASKGGIRGFIAKSALQTGDRAAQSTFDVRATKSFQNLSKETGFNFGKGPDRKKVNFQKELEDKAKAEEAFAKKLKPTDAAIDKLKSSEEYKSKEINEKNAKTEFESANSQLYSLKEKRNQLQKDLDAAISPESKEPIKRELDSVQREIAAQEASTNKLKTASETTKKAKAEEDERIKKIYENRVNSYADSIDKQSKLWQWTKNGLGIGAGASVGAIAGSFIGVGGSVGGRYGGFASIATVTTPADRNEIARKVRGLNKKKTAEQLAKEALAQDKEERKARGEKVDEDEEEKKEEKPEKEGDEEKPKTE